MWDGFQYPSCLKKDLYLCCKCLNAIEHSLSLPYHPYSDRAVKWSVYVLKDALGKAGKDKQFRQSEKVSHIKVVQCLEIMRLYQ